MAGMSLIHTHKKNHQIFNCMFGLIVCLFVFFSNMFAELMFLQALLFLADKFGNKLFRCSSGSD